MSGFFLIMGVLAVIAAGVLAKQKGRSVAGWVIASFFFPVITLIILLFKAPLCPICQNELTRTEYLNKHCPHCKKDAS